VDAGRIGVARLMSAPGRRVSCNEVLRLARRVFQATGMGPGCETEPAQAVAWLEMHARAGLACLNADLEALAAAEPAAPRVARMVDGVETLDGQGGSALPVLQDAVALAGASRTPLRLAVDRVRTPGWLAPCLAAAGSDVPLWGIAESDGGVLRVTRGPGGMVLHGVVGLDVLAGRGCAIRLGDGPPPTPPGAGWALEAADLRRRREEALRAGVMVDAVVWDALSAFARRALVPASEHSRRRGAGGGDDNL
jgi:hypothetical protein